MRMQLEGSTEPSLMRDHNDDFLLHSALEMNAPYSVMLMIFNSYPDAYKEEDSIGDLPSHNTFNDLAPSTIVRKIFEAYPAASHVIDHKENLPIHIALPLNATPLLFPRTITKRIFES